ncbi:magnesium transporter [Leucobacter komagatae]|uniref:Magnesium transporter n=1 Tax=Leucobacter komagatae TaxID=55969 RepID=A0A542Y687_9MICO|nr:CorA family divalent cation transporter [Leucobacter komagatae]TQL43601.1 magnesium transporter [Leucobacter komagatae]
MNTEHGTATLAGGEESLLGGRWLRIRGADRQTYAALRDEYGVDVEHASAASFSAENGFSYVPVSYVATAGSSFSMTRVMIAVSADLVVTIEPGGSAEALDLALARMARDGREDDSAVDIVGSILQAIADTTDELVSAMSLGTERMMMETSAILQSLEAKKSREFGVSDVTYTQQELADMESLLSHCMESQLALAEAARHLRAKLWGLGVEARGDLARLIDDIEAIEPHIDFVHDRVRLLQQTNNLALNVKQNQIIKVFSVVTAVFLPVMLLSTYYSMNFENMPILAWQYAEPMIIVLSFIFALAPLVYVRQRGWLR